MVNNLEQSLSHALQRIEEDRQIERTKLTVTEILELDKIHFSKLHEYGNGRTTVQTLSFKAHTDSVAIAASSLGDFFRVELDLDEFEAFFQGLVTFRNYLQSQVGGENDQ